MSAPLVSVVIPVFNRERFLGAAIDSVRAQTYEPVEIIVVDDGSTDASAAVAERHGATRVLRRPHNGVSAARNAGIAAARGDLIGFLDSDDIWTSDRLALQVEHLSSHPDAGLALAYAVLFVDPDDPRPDWLTEDWLARVKAVPLADAPPTGADMAGPVPYPLTMLARAELFGRLGGFDATYQPGEDLEWLLRAKDAGVRYDLIPHVVVYKRVHSGSVSNRMAEVRVSMLRLLRSSVARKRARPLVSVVIPAFNAERFLGETIESVLAQDYEPIEIVVVDDGSTDGTSEVAGSYGVRCLRTQNGGQAAARNAGVAAARGELVAFVDADDLWEPGKLSRQVGHLIAHPELGYLMSRMQRTLMPGAPWPPGTPREWFSTPQPGTLSSAGLVRRSVLEAVGEFDSGYRHGCDTDWTVRATDAGVRWEMLPDVEVQYRIHGANDSYDNMGMKDEMFKTLRSSLARKRASESTR